MRLVNVTYIEEVCGGDKDIITEMVNIFINQIPELTEEMVSLYEGGSYYDLGLIAHKAKSSIAIMGMEDLAAKLKDLEMKAKAEIEKELYQGYINDFKNQTTLAIEELEKYLSELQ